MSINLGIPEDVLPPEENQTPAESTGKVDDDTTGITDITGDSSAGILNQGMVKKK